MRRYRFSSIRNVGISHAIIAWLLFIFLTGSGSRDDILSLLVLRPLSVIMGLLALYRMSWVDVAGNRTLLLLVAAVLALPLLQLVPLPPAAWQKLPQRELIVSIDHAVGLGDVWRPLSIAPQRTWNAWFSLFVPLSVVLFLIKLDVAGRRKVAGGIILIGIISCILGILQLAGGSSSFFYLYDQHTINSPTGFFANRNHQSAFIACLFPMTAYVASQSHHRGERQRLVLAVSVAIALTFIVLLLISGSRAGIALGFVGLASTPFVFGDWRNARRAEKNRLNSALAIASLLVGISLIVTAAFMRSASLERLFATDPAQEYRAKALQPVLHLMMDYAPLGSGMGTFVEAFSRQEPMVFLSPLYLNHAHFDYLELFITGGVPAALLLLVAALGIARAAARLVWLPQHRNAVISEGRAALTVIAILALASLVDYPLRTPSLMSILAFATASVWLTAREAVAAEMPHKRVDMGEESR